MTLSQIETFKPYGDAILVHAKKDTKKTTESGIIIVTDSSKSTVGARPESAEVVAIGDKVDNVELGDEVFFEQTSGYDLLEDAENWYILLGSKKIIGAKKKEK